MNFEKDALGTRIKNNYEQPYKIKLPLRLPVIIRLDGRSFHSYTKSCQKPFDDKLMNAMNQVMLSLCEEIQGAQVGYCQSDEISILVHNYKTLTSKAWFDNELQKIASISAAIASSVMTEESIKVFGTLKRAQFDSRAFVLPEAEVNNCFLWRQKDWQRNSLQMLARYFFSQKELHGKNQSEMNKMLSQKDISWDNLPTQYKNGRTAFKNKYYLFGSNLYDSARHKWEIDNNIPNFSQDKNYIEKYLSVSIE